MATKIKAQVIEAGVMDTMQINPVVDISLNKNDLVDLIVSEREDQLDVLVVEYEAKSKQHRDNLFILDKKHEKAMRLMFNKAHGKRVKAIEKFFGESNAHDNIHFCNINELSNPGFEYEDYHNGRRKKFKTTGRVESWKVCNSVQWSCTYNTRCSSYPRTNKDNPESGTFDITFVLNGSDLTKLPTVQVLIQEYNKYYEAEKQLMLANAELNKLESMGVRAKSRMVKELLKSSDKGKQLLAKLPKLSGTNLLTAPRGK